MLWNWRVYQTILSVTTYIGNFSLDPAYLSHSLSLVTQMKKYQNKFSFLPAYTAFRDKIVKSFFASLFTNEQICECAVMTDRLEVLNLSGNRLTDACSSYLFTILQKCKGMHYVTLNTSVRGAFTFFKYCRNSRLLAFVCSSWYFYTFWVFWQSSLTVPAFTLPLIKCVLCFILWQHYIAWVLSSVLSHPEQSRRWQMH